MNVKTIFALNRDVFIKKNRRHDQSTQETAFIAVLDRQT